MPLPVNTAPPAPPQANLAGQLDSAPRSALAMQLCKVTNGKAPARQNSPTSGALENIPVIRPVILTDPEKMTKQKENFKAFSTLYSTNTGCKAINAAMRGSEFKISITDVMDEIERRNGPEEISSYKKTGIDLKSDMKIFATKENLKQVARGIYTSAKSAESSQIIYRGQGMTPDGVKKLLALWKSETSVPVHPTHFFSCDKNRNTANEFSNALKPGEKPVLFKIKGFSNTALRPHIPVKGETETLFTPHATFDIKRMFISENTGQTVVELNEIPWTKEAVPMPY